MKNNILNFEKLIKYFQKLIIFLKNWFEEN